MLLNMKKTSIGRICFTVIAVTLVAIILMPVLALANENATRRTAYPFLSGGYVKSIGETETAYISDYLYAENQLYKVHDFWWYEEYELADVSWSAVYNYNYINSGYTSEYSPSPWGEKWAGYTYHVWAGESGDYYSSTSSAITIFI